LETDGGNKFFTIAKNWWHVDKISPLKLYEENLTICGFNLNNLLYGHDGAFNTRKYLLDIYAKLFALYKDGKIKPVVDSIHGFENVCFSFEISRIEHKQQNNKMSVLGDKCTQSSTRP
jgi:hypothetical protein